MVEQHIPTCAFASIQPNPLKKNKKYVFQLVQKFQFK